MSDAVRAARNVLTKSVRNAAKNVRIVQMMNCAVNAAFALTASAGMAISAKNVGNAKTVSIRSVSAAADVPSVPSFAKNAAKPAVNAEKMSYVPNAAFALTVQTLSVSSAESARTVPNPSVNAAKAARNVRSSVLIAVRSAAAVPKMCFVQIADFVSIVSVRTISV